MAGAMTIISALVMGVSSGLLLALTVTMQESVLPPSTVVTVIVALPTAMPLTKPVEETMATAELLLLHDTALFAALEGEMVAVNVSVPPTRMTAAFSFKATPVTETVVVPGSSLPNKSSHPVSDREAKPNISAAANTCLSTLVSFFIKILLPNINNFL
jgi:hypothetical protein